MTKSTFISLSNIINNAIHLFSYDLGFNLTRDKIIADRGIRHVNLNNGVIDVSCMIDTYEEVVAIEPALISDLDCQKQLCIKQWDTKKVLKFLLEFCDYTNKYIASR